MERNLNEGIEQSPINSIDLFWMYITDVEEVEIDGENCEIIGTMHYVKLWRKLDGTSEIVEFEYPVAITIDSLTIYIDLPTPILGQNFDYYGTTRFIRY